MSPLNGTVEGAKFEDLKKIIVGDDSKNIFRSGLNCLLRRKKSW